MPEAGWQPAKATPWDVALMSIPVVVSLQELRLDFHTCEDAPSEPLGTQQSEVRPGARTPRRLGGILFPKKKKKGKRGERKGERGMGERYGEKEEEEGKRGKRRRGRKVRERGRQEKKGKRGERDKDEEREVVDGQPLFKDAWGGAEGKTS